MINNKFVFSNVEKLYVCKRNNNNDIYIDILITYMNINITITIYKSQDI